MPWFNDAGAISGCVAAYDAIGALSLADSYVNEANPGTNDAAPGTAPTWAGGAGWTFNGSTQYLTTGIVPVAGTATVLIRYTAFTPGTFKTIFGLFRDIAATGAFLIQTSTSLSMRCYAGETSNSADNAPALTAGVYGIAGKTPYRDGVAESMAIAGSPLTPGAGGCYIGALNYNNGTVTQFAAVTIQAVAIYSPTLSAGEVATITANMNALPNYSEGTSSPLNGNFGRLLAGRL